MNIEEKSLNFAINAHNGQVRKSDIIKPMIVHPIDTANILKKASYDEFVIAAGYLHDVVEDTKYTIEDIRYEFGDDVADLVLMASEKDKSLSWEDRKKETIERIKSLDMRHKAIICADKISNLSDIQILLETKRNFDFSLFNRGYDKQKWYYEEVYKSLITNEDKKNELFVELRNLIDEVFNKKENDCKTIRKEVFNKKENEYKKLRKLHYKKKELYKLLKTVKQKTYIIEFTGTPRTGKTTLINNLKDFFKKGGFKVEVIEEFTTSKRYKEYIYPLLKDKYKDIVNTEIPKYVLQQLQQTKKKNLDIIIIDRSLFDRLIWVDRLYIKDGMSTDEYTEYMKKYIPLIKKNINIIISTYASSNVSIKRDYMSNLSLEKRNFLNENNVREYNKSLLNMKHLAKKEKMNLFIFDTTNKKERTISIEVANKILNDMKKTYLQEINRYIKIKKS